jgi:hypothetical protein
VFTADGHGIADVVAVSVGAEQNVDFALVLLGVRAKGILRNPWIDKEGLAFGGFNSEGGVAQPG